MLPGPYELVRFSAGRIRAVLRENGHRRAGSEVGAKFPAGFRGALPLTGGRAGKCPGYGRPSQISGQSGTRARCRSGHRWMLRAVSSISAEGGTTVTGHWAWATQ